MNIKSTKKKIDEAFFKEVLNLEKRDHGSGWVSIAGNEQQKKVSNLAERAGDTQSNIIQDIENHVLDYAEHVGFDSKDEEFQQALDETDKNGSSVLFNWS